MLHESLPREVFQLICNALDLADLNVLGRTCSSIFSWCNPLLYQRSFKSGAYKSKSQFLYAVIYGQPNAVSKFLKAGVSMNAFENYFGDSPQTQSDIGICILSVLKRKALSMDFHPLLAAAFFAEVGSTRILLSEGHQMNIDFQNESGKVALHYALDNDHSEVVKLLLEQGPTLTDHNKTITEISPFIHAAEVGNRNGVELILNELRNRSIPNKIIKDQCERACYKACSKGYSDIVDFLLRQGGVNVNFHFSKRALLWWASSKGHLSTVKVLVKHGAKTEKETDCGVVAAMMGTFRYDLGGLTIFTEIVAYLLESGCNVANGGLHACSLWHMAHASEKSRKILEGSPRELFNGPAYEGKKIIDLLSMKGFNKTKCRNGCWRDGKKGGDSDVLNEKWEGGHLLEYVTGLDNITNPFLYDGRRTLIHGY